MVLLLFTRFDMLKKAIRSGTAFEVYVKVILPRYTEFDTLVCSVSRKASQTCTSLPDSVAGKLAT